MHATSLSDYIQREAIDHVQQATDMTNLQQIHKVTDEWLHKWPQTGSYRASDGCVYRITIRLTSTNVVIYGGANLDEVLKEFATTTPKCNFGGA